MNTKEIVQMTTEAGLNSYRIAPEEVLTVWERFAALVAAKEREACAQIVRDAGFRSNGAPAYEHIADKISARGAA